VIRARSLALAIALATAVAALATNRPPTQEFSAALLPDPVLVPGGLLRPVTIVTFPPLASGQSVLDRIADAVEGAESSHGRNPLMWRGDPRGPQGPMQITAAAAIDVGGGNRFDPDENRMLGKAYLARMFQRYGNWRDTLLAYNWGPGNLEMWINAGRPLHRLADGISSYVNRVLYESDLPRDELLPDGPNPRRAAVPAAERPRLPPHPEIGAETIFDPGLRKKIIDNNRIIRLLGAFLDAATPTVRGLAAYEQATLAWLKSDAAGVDPDKLAVADPEALRLLGQAGAKLVFDVTQTVAKRPGYENFRMAKTRPALPDVAACQLFASVLLAKIEEESAAIALVDAHRHAGRPRTSAADGALLRVG
jgi:Transglycosylase SLT domain